MNNCYRLDDYIDNRLSPDARRQFDVHLADCPACSESIAVWNRIGQEINGIGQERIAAQSMMPWKEPFSPAQLFQKRRTSVASSKVVRWSVAAAVLIGLGLFFIVWKKTTERIPAETEQRSFTAIYFKEDASPVSDRVTVGTPVHPTDGLRAVVDLHQDKVGLKTGSIAIIEKANSQQTVLRIKSGTLACKVQPRTPAHPFVVHAGRYQVTVVGTQFSVSLKDDVLLDVVVTEGIVDVTDTTRQLTERVVADKKAVFRGNGIHSVLMATAADTAEIDALLNRHAKGIRHKGSPRMEPADAAQMTGSTAKPGQSTATAAHEQNAATRQNRQRFSNESVGTWQQWVLNGRIDEAENALEAYLRHTAGNADAWFLLADCKKRKNEYRQAVAIYKKAIPHLSMRAGQTARYRAAAVLQDNLGVYSEAFGLLQKFLEAGAPSHHLEAEAMLRLGVSLRAGGETEKATRIFRDIVNNHGATSAAVRAKAFLE